MKKLFSLLCFILLGAGMNLFAWPYYGGSASFPTPTYLELARNGSDNTYRIRIASGTSACFCHRTFIVSADNPQSINGTWNLNLSSNNVDDATNWVKSSMGNTRTNPNGTIKFTYKSGGFDTWPVYNVQVNVDAYGYVSYYDDWYYWTYTMNADLPVRSYTSTDLTSYFELTDYHQISVSSNDESYGTVSGGGIFATGSKKYISASVTDNNLYEFKGWKKNGGADFVSTNPSYQITINADDSYEAIFTPKGGTPRTISAESNNTSYGTVSGGGTFYDGNPASLSAYSTNNLNYYFQEWQNKSKSATISTDNPYEFTVSEETAAITYKAIFAAREVVNITASDDMELTNGGSYWAVSGAGTDESSNNYTMNIRFDASTLTGTFNSGVNTANTWVQKEGGSQVTAKSISVATVTEPTTGNLHIVATIIGSDEKKYVITGDYTKPIVGSWANFSWDNPLHEIKTGTETSTSETCSSQWTQTSRPFLWIEAIDNSKTTNNYVLLFLATTQSSQYKGYNDADIIGPKKGVTYTFNTPSYQAVTIYCKYFAGSNTNSMSATRWSYQSETAVPYLYSSYEENYGDRYEAMGRCQQSSIVADKTDPNSSSITVNTTDRKFLSNYYMITSEGKDGKPFIQVFNSSNQLLVVIGAPAPTRRVTIANPGAGRSITITDGTNNYATGTTHSIAEGTTLTISVSTTDGTHVTGWTGTGSSAVSGSDGSYSLTVGAQNYNIAAEFASSSDITLCENCNDVYYNTFKDNYNNETVNVTYNRQFAEGRWSTMCLPFSLDLATMIANKMYGCVYEFKYATGNANVGSGVNLYFSNAKSIEAGKCYIVNANSALETKSKTPFVFAGVTIDLSKDNGAALDSVGAYDKLPGYKSQGTIELVGTLRNGTLKGTESGNTYMGLKSNKIYYPNISQGSTIWAYRGIFRSTETLNIEKMRIIVDGEDRGELILDADGDILAPSDAQSRKFIENGVLYIEREGVIYDAQGKRVEGM